MEIDFAHWTTSTEDGRGAVDRGIVDIAIVRHALERKGDLIRIRRSQSIF